MRISTKTYRLLLLFLACFLGSFTAQAQFKGEVTSIVKSDYSNNTIPFSMTEVAQALGTDTATLRAALNTWSANTPATEADKMFVEYDKDGAAVYGYTGNYGEFWLDEDGYTHAYDGASWYIGCAWDDSDTLNIYVGQMPNHFTQSDTLTTTVGIVYGGKEAKFDITYYIYMPEVPTPELQISNLDIVGTASVTMEQYPRSGYDTTPYYTSIAGVPEKFGISKTDFKALMSKMTYMAKLDSTYGTLSDSLIISTAHDGWMKRAISSTGDSLEVCGNTAYGNTDDIFMNGFDYNVDNDTLTAYLGQYPGNLKVGDKLNADIYLVYGSKAFKVNYALTIIEAPYHGLEDMTAVGDTTVIVEQNPTNDYSATNFDMNVETIAAALGTTKDNLSFQALDENNSLTSNATANNGGYWLTKTGTVTAWGSNAAFFVEPVNSSTDFSVLHVGQFPDALAAGDTAQAKLYFVSGENYYTLNLYLAITKAKEYDQSTWEVVASKPAVIQQIKDDAYSFSDVNGTTYTLPVEVTNGLIGTTEPTLYALEQDTAVAAGAQLYTKTYTCTPNPGFWLSENGEKESWGSNAYWGVAYDLSSGVFRCIQFPGKSEVGKTYNGKFYLVNEETGKMIEIKMTYQIVDHIDTIDVVGNMSLNLPLSADDNTVTVDLTSVAKALGYESTYDMLNNYSLCGIQQNGLYSEVSDPINNGIHFDASGYVDADGVYGMNFEPNGDGTATVITYSNDANLEGTYSITGTIAFRNGKKVYTISLTMMDPDSYTGIENVKIDTPRDGKIYDLSGRQISKPVKGIYIQNGKKYIVK